MTPTRTLLPVAALCFAIAACNLVGPRACTEMGCASGLAVELQGVPSAPFTLTATAGSTTRTLTCGLPEACVLFFEGFTPAEVTVTYSSDGVQRTRTFTPAYETLRPNGADCPPECRNATVVLDVG